MRIDGLNLNDDFVERLLADLGADPELLADPEGRRETVANLALYALEALGEAAAAGLEKPDFDRARLESIMLELAGRSRMLELAADRRGVPIAVWTEAGGWQSLAAAPRMALEIDDLAGRLTDQLEANAGLGAIISERLLPTNESQSAAVVTRTEADPVVVVVMAGKRYRLHFLSDSVVLAGVLAEDPELLPAEDR